MTCSPICNYPLKSIKKILLEINMNTWKFNNLLVCEYEIMKIDVQVARLIKDFFDTFRYKITIYKIFHRQ